VNQEIALDNLLKRLDEVIAKHSMLDHPFYQLWNEGKLDKGILCEYAKQYYAQVHAFPAYVSAVHSHCEDLDVRRILLENLNEEEQGVDNHPELWLRFAEGLGVSRKDVGEADLLPETKKSVEELKSVTQSDNYLEGLAALYAYESQIPEVSRTKREGLKTFYDLDDARAVSFFTVHELADIEHSQVERDILEQHCKTPEMEQRVLAAAERSVKALNTFLDGVYRASVPDELKN
jgi:pyrroloquinoline-quinone synthase